MRLLLQLLMELVHEKRLMKANLNLMLQLQLASCHVWQAWCRPPLCGLSLVRLLPCVPASVVHLRSDQHQQGELQRKPACCRQEHMGLHVIKYQHIDAACNVLRLSSPSSHVATLLATCLHWHPAQHVWGILSFHHARCLTTTAQWQYHPMVCTIHAAC